MRPTHALLALVSVSGTGRRASHRPLALGCRWPRTRTRRCTQAGARSARLRRALDGRGAVAAAGGDRLLAALDQPRLWVFDLANNKLLFREVVAHGQGTGENMARNFSNNDGSAPDQPRPVPHRRNLPGRQRLLAAHAGPGAGHQRRRDVARDRHARRALRERADRAASRAGSAAAGVARRCVRKWRGR